jgi:amidohydrolase
MTKREKLHEHIRYAFEQIEKQYREMKALYIDFHEHPELGGQEVETARKVVAYLEKNGIRVLGKNIGLNREGEPWFKGTGVVAIIEGNETGPTIAFRADMDALPIVEQENNPHRSKNIGVMHACGHDIHTTALLGAAKVLQALADAKRLDGNVVLIFQPSEETTHQKESGAVQIVKFLERTGLRDKIEAFFSLHVYRDSEIGEIGIKNGPQMASTGELEITLESSGGHVMNAYKIPNLNRMFSNINTRIFDAFEALDLEQKALVASTRTDFPKGGYNVLPSSGKGGWAIRITDPRYKEMSASIIAEIKKIVAEETGRFGAEAVRVKFHWRPGYRPVVHRSPDLVRLFKKSFGQVIKDPRVDDGLKMGGEDFAFYLEKFRGKQIPGVFVMIGAANPEKNFPRGPHHTPDFQVDPESINILAKTHLSTVLHYFEVHCS